MTYGDKERYSRQILFTGIGEQGQQRLLSSRVTIVGCGALGSVQAMELARAGVGHLTIIDRDYVEPSNLQRQLLFEESDAADGLPKAVAAERILRRINSGIGVRGLVEDLNPSNADDLLDGADLILDGTDNFETRYLINDFAVNCGVPWIYGAAVGSYGIEMPVMPGRTACLRCVYPEPPSGAQLTCENAGVLNTVTAIVASLQVADALRILSGAQPWTSGPAPCVRRSSQRLTPTALPASDTNSSICGESGAHRSVCAGAMRSKSTIRRSRSTSHNSRSG